MGGGGGAEPPLVYASDRGAIYFYVYIVPLGLINIFRHVERDEISCGLQPTLFPKFSIKLYHCQKRQNFRFISRKNQLRYQKGNKKLHINHYYGFFSETVAIEIPGGKRNPNMNINVQQVIQNGYMSNKK